MKITKASRVVTTGFTIELSSSEMKDLVALFGAMCGGYNSQIRVEGMLSDPQKRRIRYLTDKIYSDHRKSIEQKNRKTEG